MAVQQLDHEHKAISLYHVEPKFASVDATAL
jgi:hypothetical protein